MFDEAAQVLEGIGPEESSLQSQKSTSNLNMNTPMNPNKALWEKGDFTRIAESMRESGEALIQRLGISNGLKVLDLGCGDGTTAYPRQNSEHWCLGLTSRATWLRPETSGPRSLVWPTAGSRKVMRRISTKCRSKHLISL